MAEKSCVPCRGGMPALSEAEAESLLVKLPEWQISKNVNNILVITRRYPFPNFLTALAFVQQVGEVAEAQGHHPDITLGWGYAEVVYYSHKIKGLHENDFIMAAKADALYTDSRSQS